MKTIIPNGIAREVRAELGRQRLSLNDLAKRSGLPYVTVIRKISAENRELSITELFKIASALQMRPSELMTRAESKTRKEATQ